MPKYELMYVIVGDATDEQENGLVEEIREFVAKHGGNIVKEDKIGKRRLAYPIKKHKRGSYVLVQFEGDPSKVNEIDNKLTVTQGILRHLILQVDAFHPFVAEMEEEERPRTPRKHERPTSHPKQPRGEIKVDLDKQIEQALEEDLSKQV